MQVLPEIKPEKLRGNERGFALVLVLVMLALMSLLGVMALNTSTTEVGISGNYRTNQQAILAADRAIQYAMTESGIYTRIGTGTLNLNNDVSAADPTEHVTNIAAGTANSGLDTSATNQVTFIKTDLLPPDSDSDPTYFQARYYSITVTGSGPNNSTARVETQVARVVPK